MEFRKRMAERKDASKSDEWNAAYAKMEKCAPIIVFGRAIGDVDLPALQQAITEALRAGVMYEELAEYDRAAANLAKSLGQDVVQSPEAKAAAEEAARKRAEADQVTLEEDAARSRKLRAFSLLQDAMPKTVFGKVSTKNLDLAKLRAAIDDAKAAGVADTDIEAAEKAYQAASGVEVAAEVSPQQAMYNAFFELQQATPTVVFGRVLGAVDVPRLTAAIEKARKEGVDESAIAPAEAALKLVRK